MAAKTGPNLGILYGWTYRESGWKPGMDGDLILADTLLHLSVLDHETGTPPVSPTDGDRYIIPSGATGVWSGKTNQVTLWLDDTSAWSYYTPNAGWQAWIVTEKAVVIYQGSAWVSMGSWEYPINFGSGAAYQWFDTTTGFMRVKVGSPPSSETDGTLLMYG